MRTVRRGSADKNSHDYSPSAVNLNEVEIHNDFGEDMPIVCTRRRSSAVTVVFRDVIDFVMDEVCAHDIIIGCVAWMTDKEFLASLVGKQVSIVVQKEDFLRPDVCEDDYRSRLHKQYAELSCTLTRGVFGTLRDMSVCCDPSLQPVRCCGVRNTRGKTRPLMHNKFLVFADWSRPGDLVSEPVIVPKKFWTGSCNFSANSRQSLENGVLVNDEIIARAGMQEFENIYSISEPLDWETEFCVPEYRMGT